MALGQGPQTALLCSIHTFLCSRLANRRWWGSAAFTVGRIGEVPSEALSLKPLPLVSDWSVLIQMRTPKSSQFDLSKRHCPDWSEWSYSDWSEKMQMREI